MKNIIRSIMVLVSLSFCTSAMAQDTFAEYGVPYAADMLRFFDDVFYK